MRPKLPKTAEKPIEGVTLADSLEEPSLESAMRDGPKEPGASPQPIPPPAEEFTSGSPTSTEKALSSQDGAAPSEESASLLPTEERVSACEEVPEPKGSRLPICKLVYPRVTYYVLIRKY